MSNIGHENRILEKEVDSHPKLTANKVTPTNKSSNPNPNPAHQTRGALL
jgi:hypothetical protein